MSQPIEIAQQALSKVRANNQPENKINIENKSMVEQKTLGEKIVYNEIFPGNIIPNCPDQGRATDVLEKISLDEFRMLKAKVESVETRLKLENKIKGDKNTLHSDAIAAIELSRCYSLGKHTPIDPDRSLELCQLSATLGLARSQYNMFIAFRDRYDVCLDPQAKLILGKMMVDNLTLSAKQGFLPAINALGALCYSDHKDLNAKNETEGLKFMTFIATQKANKLFDVSEAQLALAKFYLARDDFQNIFKYSQMAANNGNARGQCLFAHCFILGLGTEKNEALGIQYYQLAAQQGHAEAEFRIAGYYISGGSSLVPKNEVMGYELLKRAAKQYSKAQYALGQCYEHGNGVEKDFKKAIEYYTLAADQNNAEASYELATCYKDGEIVEKDPKKAFKYCKLAADQKNDAALNTLGNFYRDGFGVDKNAELAFESYKEAAKQGNKFADYNLGKCYKNGIGTLTDEKQAFECFQSAADKGHSSSQYFVAQCYLKGEGVNKNIPEAINYYKLSAEQGNKYAKGELECVLQLEKLKKSIPEAIKFYEGAIKPNIYAVKQVDKHAEGDLAYMLRLEKLKTGSILKLESLDISVFLMNYLCNDVDVIHLETIGQCIPKDMSNPEEYAKKFSSSNVTSLTIKFSSIHPEDESTHISGWDYLVNALQSNTKLLRLQLKKGSPANSTAIGFERILKCLEKNTTITELNLNGSMFDEAISNALERLLMENSTIKHLSLQAIFEKSQSYSHSGREPREAQEYRDIIIGLGRGFCNKNRINVLDVANNIFPLLAFELLITSFMHPNNNITSLNLSGCNLDKNAFVLIQQGMIKNSNLIELDLSDNKSNYSQPSYNKNEQQNFLNTVSNALCRNRDFKLNWKRFVIYASFFRANQRHVFRDSILPLIPCIIALADERPVYNDKVIEKPAGKSSNLMAVPSLIYFKNLMKESPGLEDLSKKVTDMEISSDNSSTKRKL